MARRRKVKCDETYPRCRRCVSTGRACNTYLEPLSSSLSSLHALVTSSSDKQALEWFKLRTITKLPGTFRCEFWSKLVLQAAASQPAPRHAALALGAAHRCLVLGKMDSEGMEMLAIRHHSSAIVHLQPCFSSIQDINSLQIVLIVCLIFASLDALRGHMVSAQRHARSGLAILKLSESTIGSQVDGWISEAFIRLQVQLALLRPSCTSSVCFLSQSSSSQSRNWIPRQFRSLKLAWDSLSAIMIDIIFLRQEYAQSISGQYDCARRAAFAKQQQLALSGLRRWQTAYQNAYDRGYLLDLAKFPPTEKTKATANIQVYHILTTIMAQMCLCPGDEMAFDTQNFHFAQLLGQLQILFGTDHSEHNSSPETEAISQLDQSIIDLGCVIPLYYLATKCRVHNLRTSALRMLQCVHHREGLWDANIAALIAQKTIELEEGGLNYDCISRSESSSTLPDSQRIGSLEILMYGNPTEKIRILGTKSADRSLSTCVAEIEVAPETLPSPCTTSGSS